MLRWLRERDRKKEFFDKSKWPFGNFFIFWLGSFTKVAIVGGCPQIIRKLKKIMYILLYFTDVNQFYSHVW